MQESYGQAIDKLKAFKNYTINTKVYKLGDLYFRWIYSKTDKIINEKDINYVYNNLVNFTLPDYNINLYTYNILNSELKNVIDANYSFDGRMFKFNNRNIKLKDSLLILRHIILRRGNVVWIDFGFNIGNEFGGMHPAVILKNLDSELFVLPLSSKKQFKNKEGELTEIVAIDKINGFKKWYVMEI